jgi:hypothetical protein
MEKIRENRGMDGKQPADDIQTTPALEPLDYYFDGPNLVFTAVYHLKRGYCCRSGCRHCPYSEAESGEIPTPETEPR